MFARDSLEFLLVRTAATNYGKDLEVIDRQNRQSVEDVTCHVISVATAESEQDFPADGWDFPAPASPSRKLAPEQGVARPEQEAGRRFSIGIYFPIDRKILIQNIICMVMLGMAVIIE